MHNLQGNGVASPDGATEETNKATHKPKSKWSHLSSSVDFEGGRETTSRVPEIRRPPDQRFFKVHSDWELPHIPIFIDQFDRGQVYVLTDAVLNALPVGDRKWATIYGAITSDDVVFFHYRRETMNEANIWARTADTVIEHGRAGWIRTTVAPGGGYDVHHPTDPKFCAKVPAWPADLDEAFGVALNGVNGKGGQQITSVEHRVIAALLRQKT